MTITQIDIETHDWIETVATANGITKEHVSQILYDITGEIRERGVAVVNTTADLSTLYQTNFLCAFVKDYGFFRWQSGGVANGTTIFDAADSGTFYLVLQAGNAVLAQSANKVFAGPSTGADATPSFRSLIVADLPASTDGTFAANSNALIPTQQAAKTYTDNKFNSVPKNYSITIFSYKNLY